MGRNIKSTHAPVVIIGAGPAGYTAAIYASRAGLAPILFTGMQPGGQLTTTNEVENFPGYPNGVMGPAMMEDLRQQAVRFGADIRYETVTEITLDGKFLVTGEDGFNARLYTYDALIIATGSTPKMLGIPTEQAFYGQGVSTCAVCDGFFYRGQNVVIVGGGDTACEEALYLSHICKSVTMLVRGDRMRASTIMQQRVLTTENIEVLYSTQVEELFGDPDKPNDQGLYGVKLKGSNNYNLHATGLFLAIGHTPNSGLFKGQLQTDSNGYIHTPNGRTAATSVEGVFVAGDVADPMYRQAITSAGSGCKAALDAERWLALQ